MRVNVYQIDTKTGGRIGRFLVCGFDVEDAIKTLKESRPDETHMKVQQVLLAGKDVIIGAATIH